MALVTTTAILALKFFGSNVVAPYLLNRLWQHGFDVRATTDKLSEDLGRYTNTSDLIRLVQSLSGASDLRTVVQFAVQLKAARASLSAEQAAGFNRTIGLDERIESLLRSVLLRAGLTLLKSRRHRTQSAEEHLAQKYLGLYLLGRAGDSISESKRTDVLLDLIYAHQAVDGHQSAPVADLLATFLPEKGPAIEQAIRTSPTFQHLRDNGLPDNAAAYMTAALGCDTPKGNEWSLLEELPSQFGALLQAH